ncbi:site-2 protease family protein [Brevibacillus ruminantium]|uniref:Site-2 protease family protein n=1 Tax=Brevibacillus ruminantium TaxID=2950604 RepID=A0ABY4WCD0_9BACL|nr:site-2 protease family protein [Brevibacillus ruminantium]USG63572.1 site-2 protease family protein [Brevibacillus ruminantium]
MDFPNLFHFDWETVPFRLIAFVIAFSLHEWAHAYVAWKLGDDTAKMEGRLTVNPIPHIDPFGLILILFGPFGWAKPVPFNPINFRGNKRMGIVYVAAAGPLVNLILAVFFMTIYGWVGKTQILLTMNEMAAIAISETLFYCVVINSALFVFNLLPIHPLDGSKILRFLLPRRFDGFFHKWEIYGPWLLLLLIFLPALRGLILNLPLTMVITWVSSVAKSILSLF